MNCNLVQILKAALLSAAFSFSGPAMAASKSNLDSPDSVKQKALDLLLQKKKNQAVQLLINYSKMDIAAASRADIVELLVNMAQKFISKEAQEAYENSLNLTLENPKDATKSIEQCLALEPQQLDCFIQKMRLQSRLKNQKAVLATLIEIKELVPGSRQESWLTMLATKNEPEFKGRQIIKNFPEKNSDESFPLVLLELDRSFVAKNYSRSKDLISYLEKHYPDWPDVLFYKYKISVESSEEKIKANPEQLAIYANKCKSMSRSIARKFRYDFDLCVRGND